jgi:hypothetical protein
LKSLLNLASLRHITSAKRCVNIVVAQRKSTSEKSEKIYAVIMVSRNKRE